MSRLASMLLIIFSGVGLAAPAGVGEAPPKALVQYVQDARKLGLTDAQIQQNAVKAGWPAQAVTSAIALTHAPSAGDDENSEKQSDAAVADATTEPGSASRVVTPTPSIDKSPAKSASTAAIPKGVSSKEHGAPDEYKIGAGDVLQISVWKEPEASVAGAVVRPDGKITMPLIKEISVSGMTPTEAETDVAGRLADVITDADVTVIVKEIHSKKIYMIGAVKREGPMAYTYRMNIMQALSEAGGLTDYAKRKRIYVLRTEKGKDYRFPVDYDSVLKGEHMEMNIPLLPGDTVVVPH